MFGIIGNVGPWELILVLTICLFVFGAGKLPQAGKALGESIAEFRKARAGQEENA
ncbi:MAG: twin-arginine translocase TatA/TatE family subunit [Solirubrobacterales bacterium]